MMKSPQVAIAARLDLLQIWNYLADQESTRKATEVVEKIVLEFDRLAENPGMGHRRDEVTRRPLLFWRVYSYLIVYHASKKGIRVARVIHGARDLRAVLKDVS